MALITVFLGIAVALWASDARAQDPYADAPPFDPSAAWCTDDLYMSPGAQRYVPDGAIAQVGPYYLRVCLNGPSRSAPGERAMRFFYNPERVEGLSSVKVMTGLMVNAFSPWVEKLQSTLSRHQYVGAQQIGGATYSIYRYVRPDGDLGGATFVYKTDDVTREDALPPHLFECTQPVVPPYALQGRCFLDIG
ncbi:hypothetical protein PARPLA_00689 [Rhodobacteraceae bacterium THAF1]|uniref:hypothetical protein n=1 Tax=Palleronia sp. THAF1 TaxID=2587842 RepID=UPI000F3CF4D0|nr:hypothetical protein [Palleronia sp. THAF1]QFU09748.1 hypothetical protein FIU81_13815 [Palleronia sp. THAF1]VDC17349.1 hypothetical protein PARPLA_00689 [Rhodobacteraceae bacterium THAF1]